MSGPQERRQHERYETDAKATIVIPDPMTEKVAVFHGEVRDVSKGGACLMVRSMIHAETLGVVQLRMGRKHVIKGFEVRTARYDKSLGTLVGVRFWEEAPTKQLRDLLMTLQVAADAKAA